MRKKTPKNLHGLVRGKDIIPGQVTMPPPVTRTDHAEVEAQLTAQVETLMTKGIRAPSILMSTLGIVDKRKMARLIEMVHARWEVTGSLADVKRMRGESLHRLDLIENELWISVQNDNDSDGRIKQVALRNLLEVNRQRSELYGLSAKRMEILLSQVGAGETESRMAHHAKVLTVAKQISDLIKSRLGDEEDGPIVDAEEVV